MLVRLTLNRKRANMPLLRPPLCLQAGRKPSIAHRAHVLWTGDAAHGSGAVKAASGAFTSRLRLAARANGAQRSETAPEELIAAAHAACFSMTMAARLAETRHTVAKLETNVAVSVEQTAGGLWRIIGSAVTVRGYEPSPGLDADRFATLAAEAAQRCAVGNALGGAVDVRVEARLALATGH